MTTYTHSHLHPDWLPPTESAPTTAHPCWHSASPPAAASTPPHDHAAAHEWAPTPSATPPRRGEGPGERSALAVAEDAELRAAPPPSSDGRMTQLDHTALPLRHRIYALYCEGRSFTAIARTLWLDRGTVARHVHAIEATLLAEQSEASLAAMRLRAIEAQHAILAAAWDALKFEENQEYDYDRERDRDRAEDHHTPQPARSRRAQLLATAARAARTAAQLQGLFTPAALTAALRDLLPVETSAPSASAPSTALPVACNATDRASTTQPAASCGMPAGIAAPSASAPSTALPVACNATDRSSTTPPALAGNAASPPRAGEGPGERSAASCGMPASASTVRPPAIHSQDGSPACPPAIHSQDPTFPTIPPLTRPFAAAATTAVRATARATVLQ